MGSLEHACRRLYAAKKEGEEIFVVTGPLWLPKEVAVSPSSKANAKQCHRMIQYPLLGADDNKDFDTFVHVPTHFFKVIVVVKSGTMIQKCACYMVTNTKTPPSLALDHYVVKWKELE